MKKLLNGLFAAGVIAALLGAMALSILRPKTVNYYENRPADALPMFSARAALDGDYQDALESALHDQLPASQWLERTYQSQLNTMILRVLMAQSAARPDVYYGFRELMLFRGDAVYAPITPDERMWQAEARAYNLNAIFSAHPELRFFVYYIEKDTDVDFSTGEPVGFSEAVLSQLWLKDEQMAVFPVRSFDAFRAQFYKTDHHWNCYGSYAGYTQVLRLLGKNDPIQPEGVELVSDHFCGTKAVASGASEFFDEPFYAYRFSFPAMTCTINGAPVADYGRQGQPWNVQRDGTVSYGGYYGEDDGEVAFHTGSVGAGNLLVLGESFDNAILKLLATHFENLYAVDLRSYEADLGEPFHFGAYIRAHDIDTVLLIGNVDFFLMDAFDLED